MAWVSWELICTPKDKGGFGIKNLETFNLALLTKWRWRILVEEGNQLWKEVLSERYNLNGRWPNEIEYRRGWTKNSIWWRDLCLLGSDTSFVDGWFDEIVKLKLGRGIKIQFWKDVWLERECFADLFPSVYNRCSTREAVIEDMGAWNENGWYWNWNWANELVVDEGPNVEYLKAMLLDISPSQQAEDYWCWTLNPAASFTVKCCFEWLIKSYAGGRGQMDKRMITGCQKLWKNDAPSKVLIFAWRLLLNRVAT